MRYACLLLLTRKRGLALGGALRRLLLRGIVLADQLYLAVMKNTQRQQVILIDAPLSLLTCASNDSESSRATDAKTAQRVRVNLPANQFEEGAPLRLRVVNPDGQKAEYDLTPIMTCDQPAIREDPIFEVINVFTLDTFSIVRTLHLERTCNKFEDET